MKSLIACLLAITSLLASVTVHAGEQVGTLTQVDGTVVLYSEPSKTLQKESSGLPHALFEGEYFLVRSAKAGDRVNLGNVVRTNPGAKARLVYDNGDQFNVGPASSFRIFWDKDTAEGKTRMDLAYGKLRGIIAKGGPRSRLQIRTKAATMGVRGTDFFIAKSGATGETEVSILRGEVEVKPAAPASAAPRPKRSTPAPSTTSSSRKQNENRGTLKVPRFLNL